MTLDEMTAGLNDANAFVDGKRIKLNYGDAGVVLLDGVAGAVTRDDGAADTVISISWDDWRALAKGEIDPMSAYMSGKLRIEGDMGLAMQLQSVLAKLRP